MALLRLAFVGSLAYGFYRFVTRSKDVQRAAFADGEASGGPVEVRNAGPEGMRSNPPEWDLIDEASDESFPASDPPAVHRVN